MASTTATPVFLSSPTSAAELLTFILETCVYPSTLIVCSEQGAFLSSLVHGISNAAQQDHDGKGQGEYDRQWGKQRDVVPPESATSVNTSSTPVPVSQLLVAPLYQVAVARHIRIVFIPTVAHLRAFLCVLPAADATVRAPPNVAPSSRAYVWPRGESGNKSPELPLLVVYALLELHADTSEWSAQGLSNSVATLVEAARQVGFLAVVVEPKTDEKSGDGSGSVLAHQVPVLKRERRRLHPSLPGDGWTERTVYVHRVLSRWFRFEHNWQHGRL